MAYASARAAWYTSAMHDAIVNVPTAVNEPILAYAAGSPERARLQHALAAIEREVVEIPCVVGGQRVLTGKIREVVMPHRHKHVVARFHAATEDVAERAIKAALEARRDWSALRWEARAAVLLRAAELLATTWRARMNAATMHGQSKTAHQAEIDSACELIDFWRFNCAFAEGLYKMQPSSSPGIWNAQELRPLEGFTYAITPFNFTAIAGNLPTAPALMGNTVVWKPAESSMLSSWNVFQVLEEAGLPPGVINFLPGSGARMSPQILGHRELSAVHFTGSTDVFRSIWKTVSDNLER
ncbi:MAG: aldehyde dehydrogenase family protein, partial [Kofleriaceae bacterium]